MKYTIGLQGVGWNVKKLLVVGMFLIPNGAFADCHVVEYPDRNEVVCEEEKAIGKVDPQTISADELKKLSEKEHAELTKKTYDELKTLIANKAIKKQIDDKLFTIKHYNTMLKLKCDYKRAIGYSVAECRLCSIYYYESAASTVYAMLSTGEHYAKISDKTSAKAVYRDIVADFGDYKTEVKRAEFALEDLK